MDASDATLTEFAKSLLARAKFDNVESTPQILRAFPRNHSNEELQAALIVQHGLIEALTARLAAQFGILTAAMDRMEREVAIAKGQVARAFEMRENERVEIRRALLEIHDLAETYVDRLTENFEQRLSALK